MDCDMLTASPLDSPFLLISKLWKNLNFLRQQSRAGPCHLHSQVDRFLARGLEIINLE